MHDGPPLVSRTRGSTLLFALPVSSFGNHAGQPANRCLPEDLKDGDVDAPGVAEDLVPNANSYKGIDAVRARRPLRINLLRQEGHRLGHQLHQARADDDRGRLRAGARGEHPLDVRLAREAAVTGILLLRRRDGHVDGIHIGIHGRPRPEGIAGVVLPDQAAGADARDDLCRRRNARDNLPGDGPLDHREEVPVADSVEPCTPELGQGFLVLDQHACLEDGAEVERDGAGE
ncbi:hypothetical protein CTA1_7017 [Colletotrichum tanaceti]|uniref:Uncharacterized protein n=1 Tax=Colletotrichum tanaceti TaxID=1306861 RepID=A0A4U6X7D0_9PEZI|nr:hypothetical protein CTA1_7017 [Colletotrichum tanaceti]